jgi:Fic family protein
VFGVGRRGRARSYYAFIPDPIATLAPPLGVGARSAIAAAEAELRVLNTRASSGSPLRTLGRQLLRTEAIASSAIEGLQLSHARLARAAMYPQFDRKAREILNNVRAMEAALEYGRSSERLTIDGLCHIHALLAAGTHLAAHAGRLRSEPGWVDGTTPADAKYVPPPHEHIRGLLEDLLVFANDRDDLSPIEHAAFAHAQFETIHPFPDGNGRVGRCLIHILLIRGGVAEHYVPPISLVLAARRDAYVAGLIAFQRGDLDAWCELFGDATHAATRQAEAFAARIDSLQQSWRVALKQVGARSDSAAWVLIDELPGHPVLDARTAQEIAGRSWPAASAALEKLEQAHVLTRRNNRKRGRSWEATALFDEIKTFEASVTVPAELDKPDGVDDDDGAADTPETAHTD